MSALGCPHNRVFRQAEQRHGAPGGRSPIGGAGLARRATRGGRGVVPADGGVPDHGDRDRRTMRWKPALNAFDMTFEGRLSAGRKQSSTTRITSFVDGPALKGGGAVVPKWPW
jgi:hypothetical protein